MSDEKVSGVHGPADHSRLVADQEATIIESRRPTLESVGGKQMPVVVLVGHDEIYGSLNNLTPPIAPHAEPNQRQARLSREMRDGRRAAGSDPAPGRLKIFERTSERQFDEEGQFWKERPFEMAVSAGAGSGLGATIGATVGFFVGLFVAGIPTAGAGALPGAIIGAKIGAAVGSAVGGVIGVIYGARGEPWLVEKLSAFFGKRKARPYGAEERYYWLSHGLQAGEQSQDAERAVGELIQSGRLREADIVDQKLGSITPNTWNRMLYVPNKEGKYTPDAERERLREERFEIRKALIFVGGVLRDPRPAAFGNGDKITQLKLPGGRIVSGRDEMLARIEFAHGVLPRNWFGKSFNTKDYRIGQRINSRKLWCATRDLLIRAAAKGRLDEVTDILYGSGGSPAPSVAGTDARPRYGLVPSDAPSAGRGADLGDAVTAALPAVSGGFTNFDSDLSRTHVSLVAAIDELAIHDGAVRTGAAVERMIAASSQDPQRPPVKRQEVLMLAHGAVVSRLDPRLATEAAVDAMVETTNPAALSGAYAGLVAAWSKARQDRQWTEEQFVAVVEAAARDAVDGAIHQSAGGSEFYGLRQGMAALSAAQQTIAEGIEETEHDTRLMHHLAVGDTLMRAIYEALRQRQIEVPDAEDDDRLESDFSFGALHEQAGETVEAVKARVVARAEGHGDEPMESGSDLSDEPLVNTDMAALVLAHLLRHFDVVVQDRLANAD